jgi:hypothetical protein
MNGNRIVCDTNPIIYLLDGNQDIVRQPFLICCVHSKMMSMLLSKCKWDIKRISVTGLYFMALT